MGEQGQANRVETRSGFEEGRRDSRRVEWPGEMRDGSYNTRLIDGRGSPDGETREKEVRESGGTEAGAVINRRAWRPFG